MPKNVSLITVVAIPPEKQFYYLKPILRELYDFAEKNNYISKRKSEVVPHITLKQIGEVNAVVQKQIEREINQISSQLSPFVLKTGKLKIIPKLFEKDISHIALSIENSRQLKQIHETCVSKLSKFDDEKIDRKKVELENYSPHLTILANVKNRHLNELILRISTIKNLAFEITSIYIKKEDEKGVTLQEFKFH